MWRTALTIAALGVFYRYARSAQRDPAAARAFTVHANGDAASPPLAIVDATQYASIDDVIQKHCCAGLPPSRCAPNSGARLVSSLGVRLLSLDAMRNTVDKRAFCVPQGLHFVWPLVTGVRTELASGVVLTQLALSPRVIRVDNFLSSDEADALIATNAPRLARSLVGLTGKQVDTRTSYSAWDPGSATAVAIQRRTFALLAMDFNHRQIDGFQFLRYTSTGFNGTAEWYKPHLDYFDPNVFERHDPRVGNGSNRFATMFLYLSDVVDGGCTVFPLSTSHEGYKGEYIVHSETRTVADYINVHEARAACSPASAALKTCPKKGSAVLFYSQLANSQLDPTSLHGGCPPRGANDVKYAANVWVWNRAVPDKASVRRKAKPVVGPTLPPQSFRVVFRNDCAFTVRVVVGVDTASFELAPTLARAVTCRDGDLFSFVDPQSGQQVSSSSVATTPSGEVTEDGVLVPICAHTHTHLYK